MAKRVVIGLTGLSRSGKTTLIAAIAHLLEHSQNGGSNPYLAPLFSSGSGQAKKGFFHNKQIKSARVSTQDSPTPGRKTFPYRAVLSRLFGEPDSDDGPSPGWPERTRELSEIRIDVSYTIDRWSFDPRPRQSRLSIVIVDYPGEWITDLALLGMTYAEWCEYCSRLFASAPLNRHSAAVAWATDNARLDVSAEVDSPTLNQYAERYKTLLQTLHDDDAALSMLSPGQLVTAGPRALGDSVYFFPLLNKSGQITDAAEPGKNSLARRLEARFERYKQEHVKPFVKRYFVTVTDQIVLVDCLRAIDEGSDAVDNLERAFQRMLNAINKPGLRRMAKILGWLPNLSAVKRFYFVVTKADLVGQRQLHRLEQLLGNFTGQAASDVDTPGYRYYAVAAVRTTTWRDKSVGRDIHDCVAGTVEDTGERKIVKQPAVPVTPSDIPPVRPHPFVRFKNPGRDVGQGGMLPSLGVAALLNDILRNAA